MHIPSSVKTLIVWFDSYSYIAANSYIHIYIHIYIHTYIHFSLSVKTLIVCFDSYCSWTIEIHRYVCMRVCVYTCLCMYIYGSCICVCMFTSVCDHDWYVNKHVCHVGHACSWIRACKRVCTWWARKRVCTWWARKPVCTRGDAWFSIACQMLILFHGCKYESVNVVNS